MHGVRHRALGRRFEIRQGLGSAHKPRRARQRDWAAVAQWLGSAGSLRDQRWREPMARRRREEKRSIDGGDRGDLRRPGAGLTPFGTTKAATRKPGRQRWRTTVPVWRWHP